MKSIENRIKNCENKICSKKYFPQAERNDEQTTILIVEDQQQLLILFEAFVESLGYVALTAENVEEAIVLANEYEGVIDLLLTDINLPGMNGFDLMKKIKKLRPEIQCIYMSGYPDTKINPQEKVNFIQKPFTLKQLNTQIRKTLDIQYLLK